MFTFPNPQSRSPFELPHHELLANDERNRRYIEEIQRLAGKAGLSSTVHRFNASLQTNSHGRIVDTDSKGNPIRAQLSSNDFKIVCGLTDESDCVYIPLNVKVDVGIGVKGDHHYWPQTILEANSIEESILIAPEPGEQLEIAEPNTENWTRALAMLDYLRIHEQELSTRRAFSGSDL